MHVRPLTRTDLPRCFDIGNRAFDDDKIFRWLYPLVDEASERFMRRYITRAYYFPGAVGWVCVRDSRDAEFNPEEKHELILGFAFWMRFGGDSDTARVWREFNEGFWKSIDRQLNGIQARYEACLHEEDLAARLNEFQAGPSAEYAQAFKTLPERWQLGHIAVAPDCQRKGVGAHLMRWGMDRAVDEGVPLVLFGRAAGARLYRSQGFHTVDYIAWHEKIGAVDEVGVYVYDPKKGWSRELRDDEPPYRDYAGLRLPISRAWIENASA